MTNSNWTNIYFFLFQYFIVCVSLIFLYQLAQLYHAPTIAAKAAAAPTIQRTS